MELDSTYVLIIVSVKLLEIRKIYIVADKAKSLKQKLLVIEIKLQRANMLNIQRLATKRRNGEEHEES